MRYLNERVGVISLGCSRNTVDSEQILSEARSRGARILSVEKASTVLVNTCAFTQEAKEESIGVILDLVDLKKQGRLKKIVVHGCLVERYAKELKRNFKEVDDFIGIAGFKRAFGPDVRLTPGHWAYLKISEGCDNACSYCAIPRIKGGLKSRTEASILQEVRRLQDRGVQELNIVGQDITLYGLDRPRKKAGRPALVLLLEKILRSTQIPWIRLLYLHPRRLSEDLISLMASQERLCSYVDLPLQHISDRILKLMNRGIDKSSTLDLIKKIRERLPGVTLRTSLIVGFPSESRNEFRELLDFVRCVRFDKLGAFKYSREEGTRAFRFRGQISAKAKESRLEILMSAQQEISRDLLKERMGRIVEVMVEEPAADSTGAYLGRTRSDAPEVDGIVFLKSSKKLRPGAIVKSRVVASYDYDLEAQEV